MASEVLSPAPEMDRSEAEALVMQRKAEAAKQAKTVGDMGTRFSKEMDDLMHNPTLEQEQDPLQELYKNAGGDGASADDAVAPEILKQVKDEHITEMQEASAGKENIQLMQTDSRHLGRNQVGNGENPMELNADLYRRLDGTRKRIEQINVVYWHEYMHGLQTDAPLLFQEGHAEIGANEHTGSGKDSHRSGQPPELYGEGQDAVSQTVDVLGRQQVEEGMTKDFSVIIQGLLASEDPRAKQLLKQIAESN